MILMLQHADCEGPAYLATLLEQRGLRWQICNAGRDEWPDELDSYEAVVILGGPQSVNRTDLFPRIEREIGLVRAAIAMGIPVLGICLGAQIIASACGMQVVAASRREIGWYPVRLRPENDNTGYFRDVPEEFCCFHWHGERIVATHDTPTLASSGITDCQAVSPLPGVLALQFHLEMTQEAIHSMSAGFAEELAQENITVESLLADADEQLAASRSLADKVIGSWLDEVLAARQQQGAQS